MRLAKPPWLLNFAPVTLAGGEGVSAVGVDLAIELEQLCYSVVKEGSETAKVRSSNQKS